MTQDPIPSAPADLPGGKQRSQDDVSLEALHREIGPQLVLSSLSALLVGVAYLLLPESLTIGPSWLLLALDVVVLLPLTYTAFFRPISVRLSRLIRTGLQVVLTLALLTSIVLLVGDLPRFAAGGQLLRPAAVLWLSNVLIFAGWYWEIDGSGPARRYLGGYEAVDFLFPQQGQQPRGHNAATRRWAPGFVDYIFLAFCFATALSPADTAPLTARAKLLMMSEALISLTILVLLIARSVNIL